MLLVNPNGRTQAPFSAVEPPIWLGMIAEYNHGDILDAEAENLTLEETVKRIEGGKDVVIVCMGNNPSVSSTPKWPVVEELLRHVDARVTGLHPIAVNYPNVIKHPFKGTPDIPWNRLPMKLYRAHNWHCLESIDQRNPYAVLYTSLNCPHACNFCNVHTLYGDRVMRFRPMENIFKDLEYFAFHNIKHIKIWDELFCLNERRVMDICDYIIDRRWQFNIWAYGRVDTVTHKMLVKMKQAGINWLAYGFEAADSVVRERAHKGSTNTKTHYAIDATRDAGINILGNFLFGLPGETLDSMKASLHMAVQENFEWVNFYVALPYPGSQWYDELVCKPTDWSRFGQYSKDIYGTANVIEFKDDAFQTYFRRPEYQSMIRRKFGPKAVEHIKQMLEWRVR